MCGPSPPGSCEKEKGKGGGGVGEEGGGGRREEREEEGRRRGRERRRREEKRGGGGEKGEERVKRKEGERWCIRKILQASFFQFRYTYTTDSCSQSLIGDLIGPKYYTPSNPLLTLTPPQGTFSSKFNLLKDVLTK